MTIELIPGAEPWSHVATAADAPGALVLHGFTGNPGSMRGLAEAFADAGYHVEMPRLPGHGTTVDDMITTSWPDWFGAAEAALQVVSSRSTAVVVCGLSMGGTLTLRLGAAHPEVAGLVCVNPYWMSKRWLPAFAKYWSAATWARLPISCRLSPLRSGTHRWNGRAFHDA